MRRRHSYLVAIVILIVGPNGASAQKLHEVLFTAWGKLCSVPAAGGREVCTQSSDELDAPSWQPRGARIVAEAGHHDGPRALVLLDSTGRRIRQLDRSAGAIRPVWTPDGRYIFAIDYDLGSAVARWTADGRVRVNLPVRGGSHTGQQLTRGAAPAQFQMISFSPSGRRAALLTTKFREMVLATVSDTALTVFATAPPGFAYVSQSAWIDDDHLLFIGKRGTSRGELWELNVADGALRRRGIDSLWLRDQLAISADRGSVAVTAVGSDNQSQWNVWVYSLSAMTKRRLTSGSEDIVAGWR
jgi:Tol biopolymer transport system component